MCMKISERIKKYLISGIIAGKRKYKTGGIIIEKFVGLKPKMHSFLVNDSSEHKKTKGVKKMLFQQ